MVVWQEIFNKYNIQCNIDNDFFNFFIKGKSDEIFLRYLIPSISDTIMSEISILKDELFIDKVNESCTNILIPGAIECMETHKNCKIGIVTSSNKSSATEIINKTGLSDYISVLITSEDTLKHKPSPEPYLKAIELLSVNDDKIVIFEDSYSGYTSARNTNISNIVMVCNSETCDEIMNSNSHKINNYLKSPR